MSVLIASWVEHKCVSQKIITDSFADVFVKAVILLVGSLSAATIGDLLNLG